MKESDTCKEPRLLQEQSTPTYPSAQCHKGCYPPRGRGPSLFSQRTCIGPTIQNRNSLKCSGRLPRISITGNFATIGEEALSTLQIHNPQEYKLNISIPPRCYNKSIKRRKKIKKGQGTMPWLNSEGIADTLVAFRACD